MNRPVFPLTYDKPPYNPDKDLIPVAHLADTPMVASTSITSPYSNMQEYLAWVKGKSDRSGVCMVSLGGTVHFSLLNLNKNVGANFLPVTYKGAPNMLTDEISGVLPLGIDTIALKASLSARARSSILV